MPEGEEDGVRDAPTARSPSGCAARPGTSARSCCASPAPATYHLFAEWENEAAFNAWADDPSHLDQTAPLLPYLLESFERTTYHIVARPEEQPAAGGGGRAGAAAAPQPVAAAVDAAVATTVRAPATPSA